MLLKAIRNYLLTRTSLTALVGTRIVPEVLPQNSPVPAIDMRITSSDHDHDLAGLTGAVTSNVTFDCYADDPTVADQVADAAMYTGIVGLRGTQTDVFFSSVKLVSGPSQSLEGVDPGTDDYRYVTTFVLEIVWVRPCR